MTMIFQREAFTPILDELLVLMAENWEEIGWSVQELKPDLDVPLYKTLDSQGMLACFTARVEGQLVGYILFLRRTHPHHANVCFAINDGIYIQPEHRGQGGRFINFCEDELRALGAQYMSYQVPKGFDWGAILKHKHFEPAETVWVKKLGD